MASKSNRSTQAASSGREREREREAADTAAVPAVLTGAAADMARQQLAVAAESMAQMLRAGERLQQANLHLAQRAALLHRQAAENLRKASSPMELATIQGTLLLYQCQESLRFMQELTFAGARIGSEAVESEPVQSAASAASTPASAAQAAASAAMNAAAPMVQAWQQMMFKGPAEMEKAH
ncbi:MAG: hypothetical protein AVDCRST_MAG51-3320 [uncultured Ramlibacter sp.]|uniref:Phasin domain-containing protein n=1 Tax=uncultured Ramlibacter sp. TaxID=260755 RepID=A0A6J4QM96_9BURK|nr:MAG: hypothetical protein AVDCRST_MAG51-3320 [uncultured Ramlibacter sp.]